MLIGFSVSNYRSFGETQYISLLSTKISRHKEHIYAAGNRKILKSSLIYGANASGKSNLIRAIAFSRKIILDGMDKVNANKEYFRINKEAGRLPGVFEYRLLKNETEYSYGIAISYESKTILAEWLNKIDKNGRETCIFNRETDENNISRVESEMIFGNDELNTRLDIYLDDFRENISDAFRKKTILSDIALRAKRNMFAEITDVYEWFLDMILIFPDYRYSKLNDMSADSSIQSLYSKIMSFFDTGIEKVESHQVTLDFEKLLQSLPEEQAEEIKVSLSNETDELPTLVNINQQIFLLRKDKEDNIVYNKLLLNHGNEEELFEYSDESDGTKRLFDFIPLFYETRKDSVVVIDELDRSMHSNLIKKFLEVFYGVMENQPCQLIATTHDSNLLDLDMLRQDEIWFVERQQDHSSKLYSLNKFKERFDKRIDKEYLLGRYGAIPIFAETAFESGDLHEE